MLSAIEERVRFARRRFGHYDLIDFVAVLLGYAISGESTLKTFYERLLLDEQGERLDVVAWLKEVTSGKESRVVAFEYEGQRFSGRLIASALSPEAAERARAKARKKASKQQRELKEETLFLAGWLLVFSSLPTESWSDAQVLALYRARWQIELVIKRMKQVLKLAQLRGKTAATNEATILALLVCWALRAVSKPSGHARC